MKTLRRLSVRAFLVVATLAVWFALLQFDSGGHGTVTVRRTAATPQS